MKKLALYCAPLLLFATADDGEPKRQYSLVIDGVEHDIEAGPSYTLRVDGKDHRVQLRVKPYRRFERGGVSFHFPENMMFAVDEELPISWEFNGSSALIMLQEYEDVSEDMVSEMLVPAMKEQYEGLEVKDSAIRETFGEETLSGTRIVVFMPDIELVQDLYFFTLDEMVYALIVQDVIDRGAEHTEEFEMVMDLLRETLALEE